MTVAVELPETVLRELEMTLAELDQEVRLMAAARLYERGLASTGEAAEWVNVPRTLLLNRLADFGVDLADPSAEELLRDLENAREGCQYTSPLQYLHALRLLHILPALYGEITVPSAVVNELRVGSQIGLDLPDVGELSWARIETAASLLEEVQQLGPGEAAAISLDSLSNNREFVREGFTPRLASDRRLEAPAPLC